LNCIVLYSVSQKSPPENPAVFWHFSPK